MKKSDQVLMPIGRVIVVTGANGFVGRRLVAALAEKLHGNLVVAVVRSGNGVLEWKKYPNVNVITGDLRHGDVWKALPENATHVCHAAAVIPELDQNNGNADMIMDNLAPVANLLEAASRWKSLSQIVFSSSVSVYSAPGGMVTEETVTVPRTAYGAAKLAGEDILKCLLARGVSVACLRYSSIYGPGQKQGTVLPTMIEGAVRDRRITVHGKGRRTQDFVYRDDVADANILAIEKNASGVFNIGSGVPTSMWELACCINDVFSNRSANVDADEGYPEGESFRMEIAKAERCLGYAAEVTLLEGLRRIKEYGMVED